MEKTAPETAFDKAAAKKSEFALVGRITEAHGVRGEVKIVSYTASATDIAAYGALTNSTGTVQYEIEFCRETKPGHLIARIRGISTRNEAEKLRGIALYIPRQSIPPAPDDEFYHFDLIGLQAVGLDMNALGWVVGVHNFGAGDLLEIELASSGRTEFVPFERSSVPSVDIERGFIVVTYQFEAASRNATKPGPYSAA